MACRHVAYAYKGNAFQKKIVGDFLHCITLCITLHVLGLLDRAEENYLPLCAVDAPLLSAVQIHSFCMLSAQPRPTASVLNHGYRNRLDGKYANLERLRANRFFSSERLCRSRGLKMHCPCVVRSCNVTHLHQRTYVAHRVCHVGA